ncbi:MAG: cation diffusion facilitator family transporter [Thermoplasmata archaeon]
MRSQLIIWATLALSATMFVINLAVAFASGSHAVLSQAIYNLTDLAGGVMLMWGFFASQRPPDIDHPFGHGKERFFWAFAATLVTFTSAGLTVFVSGLDQVVAPQPVTHLGDALVVVGATLATSVAGIAVTLQELRRSRETLTELLESAHQGLKTIFFQDLVSIFASVVVFAGIVVVYRTQNYVVDGVASCGVAVLLFAAGVLLAGENRELLVGKAISPDAARRILQLIERDPRVRQVRSLQSMMLGPDDALLALKVNFQDGLTTDQIETVIDQVAASMRQAFPLIRHLVIEPES